MRKILLGIVLVCLTALVSCNKNAATIGGGSGNWTFKNINYIPSSFNNTSTRISAVNGNSVSILSIFFNTSSLPTANGNYTISATQGAGGPNAVSISLTINGPSNPTTYWATGNSGMTVEVSGNNIALVGSGIEMLNLTNPNLNDSAAVSFNLLTTN